MRVLGLNADPAHKTAKVQAWHASKNIQTLPVLGFVGGRAWRWPANSPDLNPIECLWNILKDEVSKMRPQNRSDIEAFAQIAWAAIPDEVIQDTIDARLMQECVRNGWEVKMAIETIEKHRKTDIISTKYLTFFQILSGS